MVRPPHVCIISCQHVPDDVRVTHKVGMAMREAGFRVTWVGPDRQRRCKDCGIDFRYYRPGKGRIGRLLRYRKARRLASQVDEVDVYFAVEPDSATVAVNLAKRNKAKAIFDIHEIYHDEMLGRWVKGPLRGLLSAYVRRGMIRVCSRCDLVMAVSDAVMAPYAQVKVPQLIVRSCAPMSFADGGPTEVCAPRRKRFTLMHGKSTMAHGTLAVVKAVGLAGKRSGDLKVIMFDAFGLHPESFDHQTFDETIARAGANDMIDMRPLVPLEEMKGILRQCDVGIVAYDRTWGVRSLPNKLFEYMAVGLPVIVPSYSQEIVKIVEKERCGLMVDCESPDEIAQAISHLQDNPAEAIEMGRRGHAAFMARHNWSSEVEPMLERIRLWHASVDHKDHI